MKYTLNILLAFVLPLSTFAADFDLDKVYTSYAKQELHKIESCRNTFEGCTTEQELAIAEIHGTIINHAKLQTYLDASNEQSYFIPLSLTNNELLALAAATSLGVIAFRDDQQISDLISKNKSVVTDAVTNVGNFVGSTAFIPIAAGSYFLGVVYKNNKLKKVGMITVGGTVASSIVVMGVKAAFGRMRPHELLGPYQFFNNGHHSFYSGHTSQAFTLATIISEMYKDDYPIVPWIAYGVASLTAYARVHGQDHWASDVIVGAIAGHLITKLFLSAMNGNQENRGGLSIVPGYDYKNETFTVSFEYQEKMKRTFLKCAKIENLEERIHACFEESFGNIK